MSILVENCKKYRNRQSRRCFIGLRFFYGSPRLSLTRSSRNLFSAIDCSCLEVTVCLFDTSKCWILLRHVLFTSRRKIKWLLQFVHVRVVWSDTSAHAIIDVLLNFIWNLLLNNERSEALYKSFLELMGSGGGIASHDYKREVVQL